MYILNIASTIKKCQSMKQIFIFENYYKWIEFYKENSYYSKKDQKNRLQLLTEKMPDPSNDQ